MESRFYLCDVKGNGSEDDPFRPIVADLPGLGWSWSVTSDPLTGKLLEKRYRVEVFTDDHSIFKNYPGVTPL